MDKLLKGFIASVDWPDSMFWQELSEANPEALILPSVRETPETWWQSIDATILRYAWLALEPGWNEGRGLLDLLERFSGTKQWDDPLTMMSADCPSPKCRFRGATAEANGQSRVARERVK